MSKLVPNYALSNLLEMLKREPIHALNRCRDRYQASAASHHETVYEIIAFNVEFVLRLRNSERDQQDFLTHEYWVGKPQGPKKKNLSRLATMYVLGAKESRGALYEQALIYTKVVDHFLGIDIKAEDIPAELKRKPIYKLLDQIDSSKSRTGDTVALGEADDANLSGSGGGAPAAPKVNGGKDLVVSSNIPTGDLIEEGDDDEAEGEDERSEPAQSGSDQKPKRASRRHRFNPKSDLVIMGDHYFNRVWDLGESETIWVQIQGMPPIDEWKQFKIVDAARFDPR